MDTMVQTDIEDPEYLGKAAQPIVAGDVSAPSQPGTLTVDAGVLTKAIAAACRVLERSTIPILSHVRLTWGDGLATIVGTDMEIATSVQFAVSPGGVGDCVVPGEGLHDAVKRLAAAAMVTLTHPKPDADLLIACGRFRANLRTLPVADFPQMLAGNFPCNFSMPARALLALLESTRFAAGFELSRAYLHGVYLHAYEGVLRAVATSGVILAKNEDALPAGAADMPAVIVPTRTVNEIVRILAAEGDAALSLSTTRLQITSGNTTLTSKLIDGTFPEYERVIPRGHDRTLQARKADIIRAVEGVAGFANVVSSESGKRGGVVTFLLSEAEGAIVSAQTAEKGAAEDQVSDGVYVGAGLRIGMMGRDVLAICGCLSERIEITFGDQRLPMVFTDLDRPGLLYVAMPVKV